MYGANRSHRRYGYRLWEEFHYLPGKVKSILLKIDFLKNYVNYNFLSRSFAKYKWGKALFKLNVCFLYANLENLNERVFSFL